MFDRLKKIVSDGAERVAEYSKSGPANLATVPPVPSGALSAIDPAVASAYLGLQVESIGPLSLTGPEATGFLAARLQAGLRAASAGPGETIPGQADALEARMRARGMAEDRIAAMRQHLEGVVADHQASGWTMTFVNGTHASVQVFPLGDTGSEFGRLEAEYRSQHTQTGMESQQETLLLDRVHEVPDAPYVSYFRGGVLGARGRTHEVVVRSNELRTNKMKEALAAIAALSLRSLEG